MFKRDMTPLTPKGQTIAHKGKGSKPMPPRDMAGKSMNDFAKATPMAQPKVNPAMPGPGMGGFPGDGF